MTTPKTHSAKQTRREFLASATIAATVAPAALGGEQARPSEGLRIDCQSHLFCPEIVALMEKRRTDPRVYTRDAVRYLQMGDWLRKIPPHYLDVDAKLAAMDSSGIALTALSINDPGPEWFGNDGVAMAQMADEFVAGIAPKHPDRFFGLCVLPLQDMQASLAELDRSVHRLGTRFTNSSPRKGEASPTVPLTWRAVITNETLTPRRRRFAERWDDAWLKSA